MLQRQIMYKQLQELQRTQQIQELSGVSNQDYVDQLTSSRQPSAVQLSPTVNREPICDSRMLMFDNMQMAQQGESGIFQGFPSGLVLSQGQSNALAPIGMSPPQFDMSIYGNPGPNVDKNLNQYPYPHDLSNFSANLLTKNSSSPLASSFMTQQGNFSVDQSSVSDGSLLSCQVFQEKNFFEQVPFHSSNSNLFPMNYSQGITMQRSTSKGRLEDTGWPGYSPGEVSEVDISKASATLDQLEQKILYSSDDRGWLSSFGTSSKKGGGDYECTIENPSFVETLPSIQSGSWSALMQSAVTETSSSDTVVQEEWSELSFQNPEPSSDNQPSNLSNGENLQDNCVDRNLQNVSSPSSEPEQLFTRPDMNCSFPGFQHSGKHNQRDEFQCESSCISGQCSTDYTQLKHPTGRDQLVQSSLLSENTRMAQYKEILKTGHELQDTLWRSNPVSSGFQTPFGQLNQPNFHRYSVESEKMGPGGNVGSLSAHLGASDLYCQNLAAQSILPNSQEFGFRPGPADSSTPQSYSLFPSLPMGNVNVKYLPNSYEKDYIKNQHPTPSAPSYMTNKFQGNLSSPGPRFSLSENIAVTQPSGTSVSSQHVGFPTGLPPLGIGVTTQQDANSPRANRFLSSLFRTPGSASSSLETDSQAREQSMLDWSLQNNILGFNEKRLEKVSFLPDSSTMSNNPTPLSSNSDSQQSSRKYSEVDGEVSGSYMRHTSPQPSDQVEQKDVGRPIFSVSDTRASGHSLNQNYTLLHQFHQPRDGQTDCGKRFPFTYQQANANSREPLLSGQRVSVKDKAGAFSPGNDKGNFTKEADDQPAKASSTDYLRSSQQTEMLGQNESPSHSIDEEASNVAYQSQISLQMAPSLFKHYRNLNNFQAVPTYQKAATTAMPPFSRLSIGNLPENRLNMQVDSVNTALGSGTWPSSAATVRVSKHLSPPSMLPSDASANYQNLPVSKLGKRKIVAFDLESWHKEVNSKAPRPQSISMAEFEWAQALNRKQEEARNEAEIVDVHPVVRAKRRLSFTTQLMQQVFRPSVEGILFGDASSNCDFLAYSAARTMLGDACNLNSKTASDSNDVSPEKLNTSKRTSQSDFSKTVECLVGRAEKLEGDLSRLGRSLSVVDIKVESHELEKFSTLNRFAKFHFKAHVDPASSSGPSKTTPQRYIKAAPMPKIIPEGRECISL